MRVCNAEGCTNECAERFCAKCWNAGRIKGEIEQKQPMKPWRFREGPSKPTPGKGGSHACMASYEQAPYEQTAQEYERYSSEQQAAYEQWEAMRPTPPEALVLQPMEQAEPFEEHEACAAQMHQLREQMFER